MTLDAKLLNQLDGFHPVPGEKPKHLGIIPDGSRRWAKKQGIPLVDAYKHALTQVESWIKFAYARDYEAVSVYMSSHQNYRRKPEEVEAFSRASEHWLRSGVPAMANQFGIKITFAGDESVLPDYVAKVLHTLVKETAGNTMHRLYLCVAYNPLLEILQATSNKSESKNLIDSLQVSEPLDLVIRSGDAPLTSNFLPLQTGFAHKIFRSELFSEISIEDFESILNTFEYRKREFGI